MRKLVLLVLVLWATCAVAQSPSVAGKWRVVWANPAGYLYSAEMTLTAGSSCKDCAASGPGSIRGQIVWTLHQAANSSPADKGKVGMTGTEYVSGQMAGDGFFIIEGYRKDDPNNMIGLDRYRLAIGENGETIGGITRDNGPWIGQFFATREP